MAPQRPPAVPAVLIMLALAACLAAPARAAAANATACALPAAGPAAYEGLAPTWDGDLRLNLSSFALYYRGRPINPAAPVNFGDDPLWTPDAGAAPSTVAALRFPSGGVGPESAMSFFAYPFPQGYAVGDEALLSYSVFFEYGFAFSSPAPNATAAWTLAGVLPGLAGVTEVATDAGEPQACVPGAGGVDGGDACVAVRPVWGPDGAGAVHVNAPRANQTASTRESCDSKWNGTAPGNATENGFFRGVGAFEWATDRWQRVEIYAKLNTLAAGADGAVEARPDGVLRMSVDGVVVASSEKVVWRTRADVTFTAVHMGSYFASGASFAAAQEKLQNVLFSDFGLQTAPRSAEETAAAEELRAKQREIMCENTPELCLAVKAASKAEGESSSGGGSSAAVAAGAVIGVLAAVGLAVAAAMFVARRRRAAPAPLEAVVPKGGATPRPSCDGLDLKKGPLPDAKGAPPAGPTTLASALSDRLARVRSSLDRRAGGAGAGAGASGSGGARPASMAGHLRAQRHLAEETASSTPDYQSADERD